MICLPRLHLDTEIGREGERWKPGLLTDDDVFHEEVWPQRMSSASFERGRTETEHTISFEELSGVSIVVAYGHLSWGSGRGMMSSY